jgi:hypothetical protein
MRELDPDFPWMSEGLRKPGCRRSEPDPSRRHLNVGYLQLRGLTSQTATSAGRQESGFFNKIDVKLPIVAT